MTTMNVSEARDDFAELVNRVAYGKERVVVSRRGKQLVAIVPVEDLAELEARDAAEDAADVAAAEEALADPVRIPYSELRAKLGLE